MELVERLQLEIKKGFSKSELERIVDLPLNTLSSILTGKKKMTAKHELSVSSFLDKNPNLNPLDYPKRTRKPKVSANDKVEADNRNNPLTNAARGRDSSGINEDEGKPPKKIVLSKDSVGAKVLAELSEKKQERERDFREKYSAQSQPKWDFSKVMFLNIEEFTEYPKNQCPPNGYQRNDYLAAKKIADDKIREAFNIYKQSKS